MAAVKIVNVIGTRPQFIKVAVVTRALREDGRFEEVTVDTGQHYDPEMSALLLEKLEGLQPARSLGIHGDSTTANLARMVDELGRFLDQERPDRVLVYGDTNSTLAGALAASILGITIAHVEAGLRSFNRAMAEERNRVVADRLSDLLFCPTTKAVENLDAEGITEGVHHVGDVMHDLALMTGRAIDLTPSTLLDELGVERGQYAVATVHRAETTDDRERLQVVLAWLRDRAREHPVLFPVHPRTRSAALRFGLHFDGLATLPPLGYVSMARLVRNAAIVYTDSGGLQKEAYFHGVQCVTLRNETEWTETVEAGWNRLWTQPEQFGERRPISDYGDGHAARAIVEVLAQHC